MAIWKESSPKKDSFAAPESAPVRIADQRPTLPVGAEPPARPADREVRESVVAAGLAIEGKIEGSGHVRIAGRFTGDVQVQGNLTIEPGAKVTGGVRAATVTPTPASEAEAGLPCSAMAWSRSNAEWAARITCQGTLSAPKFAASRAAARAACSSGVSLGMPEATITRLKARVSSSTRWSSCSLIR